MARQFWAKASLDVTIEKGTGSAAATQAIAQGRYQFGIPAAPNAIQQEMKGVPLLSLGCFNYDTTMGIAVRPESPIKAPADLKGKKVGSTLTSGEYPLLPAFLKNVNLTMGDIQSIALDNKVREFITAQTGLGYVILLFGFFLALEALVLRFYDSG